MLDRKSVICSSLISAIDGHYGDRDMTTVRPSARTAASSGSIRS